MASVVLWIFGCLSMAAGVLMIVATGGTGFGSGLIGLIWASGCFLSGAMMLGFAEGLRLLRRIARNTETGRVARMIEHPDHGSGERDLRRVEPRF